MPKPILAIAAALALGALSACGDDAGYVTSLSYPASPTLGQFGVAERCGRRNPSCEDQAQRLIGQLLTSLGRYAGDDVTATDLNATDGSRLAVRAESSAPMAFSGPDGDGETNIVVIDLTALQDRTGPAYVVVDTTAGSKAFEADPEVAGSLLEALFRQTP